MKDSYAWFRGMVAERRKLDRQRAADASPTAACSPAARRSTLKLVDELGDEKTAIAWLAKEKNIDPKTPVRDYQLKPRFGDLPFLHVAAVGLLDAVGLAALAQRHRGLGRRPGGRAAQS